MYKFKELPDEEKPRERLMLYGVDVLSNEELLMILLKTGSKKYSVKELANLVLTKSGGINKLKDIAIHKLMEIDGIGKVKAIELMALIELSKKFAIEVVNLCRIIKEERKENVLVSQLLRSGTSIGANIHEAQYAQSRKDFISKLEIALKESNETSYWLKLLLKTNRIDEQTHYRAEMLCGNIRRLLIASVRTAKENQK